MPSDDTLSPIEPSNPPEKSGVVERIDPQLIQSLVKEQMSGILLEEITHTIERRMEYSGPIPPPEVFRGYEDVLPGSADRILAMTEKQVEHRISAENKQLDHSIAVEKKLVQNEIVLSYLGLISGFIVAIFGLSGAIYLGEKGKTISSGIMSATTLVGLVSVFVSGKSIINKQAQNDNRSSKDGEESPE